MSEIRPYSATDISTLLQPTSTAGPYFTITPVLPPGPSMKVLLGEGVPKVDLGDSGWAVVDRPKRYGFVEWRKADPRRLTVPVMFDGLAEDRSVESEVLYLYRLIGEIRGGVNPMPAIVKLAGPLPLTFVQWAITAVELEEQEIRRPSDGHRVRTAGQLSFLQWVPGSVQFVSPAAAAQVRAATPPPPAASSAAAPVAAPPQRVYVVRKGDTLWRIAQTHLGNPRRWPEIANMNGIRDPRKLQIGTRLRLP